MFVLSLNKCFKLYIDKCINENVMHVYQNNSQITQTVVIVWLESSLF